MSVFELGFGQTAGEIAVERLPITGTLPEWLTGTLIRNGPGTFRVGEQRYRHWFDGLAMLHKFSFGGGQVSYANKYLAGKAYQTAQQTGQITYSEFATDPCRSLFGRIMAVFSPKITDSAKVSLARLADQFIALAETPIQVEFDKDTLDAVGVFSYESGVVGQMTTAHPHIDPAHDLIYNVVTRFNRVSHYRVYGMSRPGAQQLIGSIPTRQPSYMHSFGMSPRYIIVTEFPLVVNPISLLLWLRPFIENYRWKPRQGTPFWIMDRFTGEVVARFESEAFFAFHHVNAFERGDELFVDLVAYPDAGIVESYYLNRLADQAHEIPFGQLRRYRLPLGDQRRRGTASYEVLSDACIELPRFDYDRLNMDGSYRYVYGIGIAEGQRQGFYNQIVKVDLQTGGHQTWSEPGCYPGEPVFVRHPQGRAEDDGVALSVVLDANQGTSFLLVLDAASFAEIGRAQVPQAILFGYHGAYFDA